MSRELSLTWAADLPLDWSTSRLARTATIRLSNVDKHSSGDELAVRLVNYVDVYKNSSISGDLNFMRATAKPEQIAKFRVRPGDTLITKDSETADDIGIPAYVRADEPDLVCGYHLAIVRPERDQVEPRFLFWLLESKVLLDQWIRLATGITRVGLRGSDISKASVPVPERSVQRRIAGFLDRETARIDTLIEKQEKLIETLLERKISLRAEMLNPKSDGRPTTIRRVLAKVDRPAIPNGGVVTAYRDGYVTLRSNRREDGYTISLTESGYQGIEPGDLVFHALDGFAGAVGISDSRGNGSPVYHVCQSSNGDDPEYLSLLLRFLGTSGFLATQAPNVRQRSVDFRNWTTFAAIPLNLPPHHVQASIAREIKYRDLRIDTLITKTQEFINITKERRSALITAAVTGQIDVMEDADG